MSGSTGTPGSTNNTFSPLINEQYRITKRLGGGSFGDIYLGLAQNGERVAVKFEKHSTRCPQLRHEYKVYREMQNCSGFGRVYCYGTHHSYNAMVMDLLGPSLEDQFTKCGRRFSLKTVLQIADQLLERMETMHSRHIIHRDVKPANFVLGPGRGCQKVFCIDFGLSTRYRHPRTLQHIPYRDGRSLTGTPRYASINNHLGLEQSRRDDLESVGYVLVYFLKGSLPWQGLKARNAKRKYNMILERKQAISIQQLCQGLPQQFAEYLAYCRSLKFDAKPNVPYLQGLLRELYKAQGHSTTGSLDWDWNKFDAPESGRSDGSSGGGIVTSAAPGNVGAVEATAGTVPGLATSTAAEGITSRTQAATADGKHQLQQANLSSEFPGFDGSGVGTTRARKVATADVNRSTCPDDANDRHVGDTDDALKTSCIPGTECRSGKAGDGAHRHGVDRRHDLQEASGWSKWSASLLCFSVTFERPFYGLRYPERLVCLFSAVVESILCKNPHGPTPNVRNLRPKTSAAFWAGATRGWSARDASSRQSRTVPVAGVRAVSTITMGSPLKPERPSTGDDANKEAGDAQIANRRWSGTSISASADMTNKVVRPHTAHGVRNADIGGEAFSPQGATKDGGEAAPVVAGARGVMRYRNERSGSTTSGGCYSWFGGGSSGGGVRGPGKGTLGGQRPAMGTAKESLHQRGKQQTGVPAGAWSRAAGGSAIPSYARSGADGAKGVSTTRRPGTSGSGVVGATARASRSSYTVHGRGGSPFGGDMASTNVGMGRHRPLSARSRGLGVPSRAFVHPTSSGTSAG